jgi:hypothetical protein
MNRNLTEISKATQWKPGQSGNPNGRPVGAGFFRDLAEVWAADGRGGMLQTAKTRPATFLGIASHLIPQQVAVDLQASLPGKRAFRRPRGDIRQPSFSGQFEGIRTESG